MTEGFAAVMVTHGLQKLDCVHRSGLMIVGIYRQRGDGLGAFGGLESVVVSIHGKWALWRAWSLVAVCDPRFQRTAFEQLATRAMSQHDKVDARRVECERSALCLPTEEGSEQSVCVLLQTN